MRICVSYLHGVSRSPQSQLLLQPCIQTGGGKSFILGPDRRLIVSGEHIGAHLCLLLLVQSPPAEFYDRLDQYAE